VRRQRTLQFERHFVTADDAPEGQSLARVSILENQVAIVGPGQGGTIIAGYVDGSASAAAAQYRIGLHKRNVFLTWELRPPAASECIDCEGTTSAAERDVSLALGDRRSKRRSRRDPQRRSLWCPTL
jgi:hypothetical protein